MRRQDFLCGLAAVLLLASTACAAEVKTMDVTFKSGDEEVKGFLAVPEGKGPFPAVVVIQEWWGLNDWMKEQTKKIAEQGYVALAPDLYRGKVARDPKTAGGLMKGLPRDRAVRDLKGAVDYLTARKDVNKEKVGSIGWCMGGGYSLQLALADKRVKACVMCYGRVVTNPRELAPLNAEVLGIFGEEDKGIKADDVKKFEAALKEAGKKVDAIHIYPHAGHGFMREGNPSEKNPEYRPEQAKKAWAAIDHFFARTLKEK